MTDSTFRDNAPHDHVSEKRRNGTPDMPLQTRVVAALVAITTCVLGFIALGAISGGSANAAPSSPPAPTVLHKALCINGNTVNGSVVVPIVPGDTYQSQIDGTWVTVSGQVSQPPGPRQYRALSNTTHKVVGGPWTITITYQGDASSCTKSPSPTPTKSTPSSSKPHSATTSPPAAASSGGVGGSQQSGLASTGAFTGELLALGLGLLVIGGASLAIGHRRLVGRHR